MITKRNAINTPINWKKVEKATEIPRTYQLIEPDGSPGIIFKMYKPSQLKYAKNHPVFGGGNVAERYRTKAILPMGIKDRSRKNHGDRKPKDIFRERKLRDMTDASGRAYCY